MPGLSYAGMYSHLLASKETAIAYQNPLGSDSPRLFGDLIIALSYILDVQENPNLYHAWRVAAVSGAMAEQLAPGQVTDVFFAALLHDIGAMGRFPHMVHYPTLYSQKANPDVVAHPERGREILSGIPGMELSAGFVADHHEWWSGAGYPARKAGEDIPFGAQVIRLADSAEISKKFRPEASAEQALEEARLMANIEISPEVVEAYRAVISQKEFYRELVDETKLHFLIDKLESGLTLPIFRPNSDVIGTVLTVFARTVDAKHGFTSGHSERVSAYAVDLGKVMELSHHEITKLRFAGLLHDAGKVAVPRSIMDKPGPLGPSEFLWIRHHPILTMDILANIAHLSELAWIAGHHHERWDGGGYPDSLSGEDIPLLSRILAVADAVDAITSLRSYRQTLPITRALEILRQDAGTQFDPHLVEAAHVAWGAPG
jgi:HD-GYP domain-containing protein (c-di-GMP phosphodiesterase class II)